MGDCKDDDFRVIEGAHCERCRLDVLIVEKELYEETGLCGWCAHMMRRMIRRPNSR
jgi:hypothetical protein